jgi:hypothetical protein
MAIYPIDLPSNPAWYKTVKYTQRAINSMTANPFSGAQQVYVFGGGWWEVDVVLRPMRRDNAADWMSSLLLLHGKEGTFNLIDPVGSTPRGAWSTNPTVWHPSSSYYAGGVAINVGGFAANQLNCIRVGDWFNIANMPGLYQVTVSSVNANASGVVYIEFWPPARATAIWHGWQVFPTGAKGVFRLKADTVYEWSEGPLMTAISFSGMEAI